MNQTHSTVVEVIARGEQGPVLARSGGAVGGPAFLWRGLAFGALAHACAD